MLQTTPKISRKAPLVSAAVYNPTKLHKIDHTLDVFLAFANAFLKYTLVEKASLLSYLS